ncbi:hypothetical protein [Marinibacterium profundimaris]|uniref:Uncharacterized protein n=1 Tax=Marinibacterium profundimaris TaxID=1679460 RepID=A0A225NPK4_9RHOB|nr:hypothetical protein [Marinibacterium profundimaris]OWU75830.1 hypothetical protein ATO3_06495 [Marinibacterium profundimaris]
MRILYRSLCVLLVVMLLPWGAWLSAAPVAAVARAAELHGITETHETAAPTGKRCRTATLPGTHCALPAILPGDPGALRPDGRDPHHPAPGWAVTGHQPQPPRSPPRPI